MPIERLRIGCGLQCTLPHVPLVPSSRPLLFSAAVKLLKFAMGCKSRCTNNPVEDALMKAMFPLLCNPDEHVLSTLGSLVLALLEGKTDLPISGVFGAGKTRSAAILMVGLLVFDFFFNRWLHRISRILAVLDYEGVKQATPEVLRPKRKSSAHFTMT